MTAGPESGPCSIGATRQLLSTASFGASSHADPQRAEEPAVVGRQVERPCRAGQQAGRRRDLGHGRCRCSGSRSRRRLRASPSSRSRPRAPCAAGFDLRILGDRSGNRVGQLFREPVHDVIHSCSSSPAAGPGSGALPIRTCTTGEVGRDRAPKVFICRELASYEGYCHCRGTLRRVSTNDLPAAAALTAVHDQRRCSTRGTIAGIAMATRLDPRLFRTPDDLAGTDSGQRHRHARASFRSPAASSRPCTAAGSGRCGSTPASATAAESNRRYRYLLVAGRQRPERRLRPADADRLRLRPPAGGRRGRPGRRRDRLDRGHGRAVRRHPARPGVDVDDDQRDGDHPAGALRRGRRGGRASTPAQLAGHGAERHPQGVRRARHLHLPAARRRCASSPTSSRSASASCRTGTRSRSAAITSARRLDGGAGGGVHARQRASPTCRRRSTPASTSTRSASGCRSSSTPTTTSSRRSPSSAPRGGCGRASCATASARPTRARSSCASTPRPPAAR